MPPCSIYTINVIAVDCESCFHPSCILITMEISSDKVIDKASQNNVVEVQVSVNIAVLRVMKILVHSIMGLYNNMDWTRYITALFMIHVCAVQ